MKLVAGCLAVAALSLLLPWALAFDPQVWVMWGHDIVHGHLDTTGGPSWKPLPVAVTTLLAPAGDASEALWLILARAGGLLAVAGAALLARRLAGRTAAIAAAVAIVLSPWWLINTALGNSEGLLAAVILFAALAHLDGRHGAALLLGTAAALIRPEIWPFLALYGLWLLRARPVLVVGAGALVLLAWFGPDVFGLGAGLKASHVARSAASPGSAQYAAVPFLAVLWDQIVQMTIPAFALALLAVKAHRPYALAALAYVLIVAVSAQAGYAGNPRYLVPAAAVGAVLAGCGVARHARLLPVFVAALVAFQVTTVVADSRDIGWRAGQRTTVSAALERAGGERALKACGTIRVGHFWRALVAARLHIGLTRIDYPPVSPGVLVRAPSDRSAPFEPAPPGPPFTRVQRSEDWEVWTTCPRL